MKKRDSDTGVFLRIFQNFKNTFFIELFYLIFSTSTEFYYGFEKPKRDLINSIRNFVYELFHELQNKLRL